MKISQVYQIVNDATKAVLGETAVVAEDLTDVVSIGEQIANADLYDKYVGALVNRIAKTIFSIRAYSGRAPKVLMDSWEFGSIVQKVHMALPEAEENESWELVDGATYEENQFYKPSVSVKLWNHKTTFEIPLSIAEIQLKQSFLGAEEMARFVAMIYQAVENSLTLKFDALIMRTINHFSAVTYDQGVAGANKIQLLTEYAAATGVTLSAATALYNKDFLRFVAYRMKQVASRLASYSTLFNLGATEKHTPREDLRIVMLDNVDAGVSAFLQSDTFHEELVKLPEADVVSFWQGTGTSYALVDTSNVNVKATLPDGTKDDIEIDYLVAVMFDMNALGVTALNKRTTSKYNAKGEFYNYWYKEDAGYFNDFNENFVVFVLE